MSTHPPVTVVIPTRDRRALLQRALDTALAQEDVPVHVVVVDEGSTDDTPAYLGSLEDPRVVVVRHDVARGLPAARNAGIAVATTPFVAFLDDDDVWAPSRLARQLSEMARSDARWGYCGAVVVDRTLRILGALPSEGSGDVFARLLGFNVVPGGGSAVVAARDLVQGLGGFDTTLTSAEDWDMWIRLAAEAPAAVVRSLLVGYTVDRSSMSHDVRRMEQAIQTVAEKHEAARRASRTPLDNGTLHWYFGELHLRNGSRWRASRSYLRAAWYKRHPRSVLGAIRCAVAPESALRRSLARSSRKDAELLEEAAGWLANLWGSGGGPVHATRRQDG
jgi:glycosyltransferase involved in cell wall biosynthesis